MHQRTQLATWNLATKHELELIFADELHPCHGILAVPKIVDFWRVTLKTWTNPYNIYFRQGSVISNFTVRYHPWSPDLATSLQNNISVSSSISNMPAQVVEVSASQGMTFPRLRYIWADNAPKETLKWFRSHCKNVHPFWMFMLCRDNSTRGCLYWRECPRGTNQNYNVTIIFYLVPSSPVSVHAVVSSTSTIDVKWMAPDMDAITKSIFLGYYVYIRQNGMTRLTRTVVAPPNTTTTLSNLPAYKEFQIWVSGFTLKGEGMPSSILNLTITRKF